jgi:hypothetical protein
MSSVCFSESIDLSGEWKVRLDPQDTGEEQEWFQSLEGTAIQLPGIVTEAGLGDPLVLEPALSKEVFKHLHQKHRYVGAAWYVREFEYSTDWENTILLLERVIWESTVWVNGHKVGSQDSLSTPHRHAVGQFLQPGNNIIAVRVDNREKVNIGDVKNGLVGHAYTEQTQTIWNGLVGKIELQAEEPIRIKTNPLRVEVPGSGELIVQIEPVNHEAPALPVWSKTVTGGETQIPTGKVVPWSEFTPALYRVTARFQGLEKTIVTGFRDVEVEGRELRINGRKAFMRGTLECCIFPKTGYPPTDAAGWDKVFATVKEYGLNHIRFHSWCPPEAAFASADRHGIYLQAELPNWSFQMGKLPDVDAYFMQEGERIIREFGHHPSFVFFSLGNELQGNYAEMDKMVERLRKLAPHLLYTSTSYSFSERGLLPGPADDFFISQRTKNGWVRQGWQEYEMPTTDSDYSKGLSCFDIPFIAHEIGQFAVYPNLAELPKYNGNLRALGFEAIQQDLQRKGRLDKAAAYTANSGKLAAILYKEQIERFLRTPGVSGFQLLDLHDFPGQHTATVGLLDAFWDSKGIIAPEEFRRFCAPVVPLLRMGKRVWRNSETFTARIEVANFLPTFGEDVPKVWKIEDEAGNKLAEGTTDGDVIEFPLSGVQKASKLNVAVSTGEYSNDWKIWVYPETKSVGAGSTVVVRHYGKELLDALSDGKKVLFLPTREDIADPLHGSFTPVFWSPVNGNKRQQRSLGMLIDSSHPIFADFPTSTHTDWQWCELLVRSTAVNADSLGAGFEPIMQCIDQFDRNSMPAILWEAKVGAGSLLVCSLDIESDPEKRIVAAQLQNSILAYMNGRAFAPKQSLSAKQLTGLFLSNREGRK